MLLAKLLVELGLRDELEGGLTKSKKSVKEWGASLRQTGTVMTAAVTTPIIGGFVKMVQGASDLAEATSAVETTYGNASKSIIKSSQNSAQAVGLSQAEYLSASTTLGVFGKMAGATGDDLSKFGQTSIGAASDLASFYNAPVPEALAAIQSGLMGETEPLRKFGIMMNEATIQEYAMANGIWDGTGAMTEQQKVAARHGYIMDNLGDAAGDFERTQGGLANQTRIAKAQLADLSAEMGKVLLPYALKLIKGLSKLVKWVKGLSATQKKWVVILAAVAAAIGPVLILIGAMIPAIGALGVAIGILTGPIGLVVLALVGLGIAYKTNLFGFADAVNWTATAVWNIVKPIAQFGKALADAFTSGAPVSELVAKFPGPLQGVAKAFLLIADAVGDLVARWKSGGFDAMLDLLPAKLAQVGQAFGILRGEIRNLISRGFEALWNWIKSVDWVGLLLTAGSLLISGLKAGFDATWPQVTTFLSNIPGWTLTALGELWEVLKPQGTRLIAGLAEAMRERWAGLKTWLSQRPGATQGAIGKVIGTLKEQGKDLLTGLKNGLEEIWSGSTGSTIKSWLRDLPRNAMNALGIVTGTLTQKGRDLLQGMRTGIDAKWVALRAWLFGLDSKIIIAVGELGGKLVGAGKALISGLQTGINVGWTGGEFGFGGVKGWLSRLGISAAGAVGSLLGRLYQAGKDLIQGLINGIYAMWNQALSVAGSLADAIGKRIKDALKVWSPSRVMVDVGKDVGAGLVLGMKQAIPSVERTSDSMAMAASTTGYGNFNASRTAGLAASSGTTMPATVNQTININGYNRDPRELAEAVIAVANREIRLAGGFA